MAKVEQNPKGAKSPKQQALVSKWEKLGSLAGFMVEFLSTLLSAQQLDYWFNHKTEFKKKIREVFSIVDEYASAREEWQKFYKQFLNWDVDFSAVIIPMMPAEGKWRLLFIAKGLTPNKVFNAWTFKKWKAYDDIDASVTVNVRKSSEHYAIWVRDSVEPDEEFLGKSTKEADPDMQIGVTLLEQMVHESKYFSETGNHLDVKGLTFCSGSRDSDGCVPSVCLSGDGDVRVDWRLLGGSLARFGIRRAVKL